MSLNGVTVSELSELTRDNVLMDDYIPILDSASGDLKKVKIGGTTIIQGICNTPAQADNKVVLLSDIDYAPAFGDIFQIVFVNGNLAATPTLNINDKRIHPITFHGVSGSQGGIDSPNSCSALLHYNGNSYEMIATNATYESTNAHHADLADLATEAIHAERADEAEFTPNADHANTADNANHADVADHANSADAATQADFAQDAAHASTAEYALNSLMAQNAQDAAHASTAEYAIKAGLASTATLSYKIRINPSPKPTENGSIWIETT